MDRQSEIRYLGQSKNKYYLQIESDYSLFCFFAFWKFKSKMFLFDSLTQSPDSSLPTDILPANSPENTFFGWTRLELELS